MMWAHVRRCPATKPEAPPRPAGATYVRRRCTASFAHGTSWPTRVSGATRLVAARRAGAHGPRLHRVTPRLDPVDRWSCCVARSRCDRLPARMGREYATLIATRTSAENSRTTRSRAKSVILSNRSACVRLTPEFTCSAQDRQARGACTSVMVPGEKPDAGRADRCNVR